MGVSKNHTKLGNTTYLFWKPYSLLSDILHTFLYFYAYRVPSCVVVGIALVPKCEHFIMLCRILEGSTRTSEVILSHHVEPSQYCCGGIIMMRGSPCLMCAAFATRRLTLRSLKKSNGTKKALYKIYC